MKLAIVGSRTFLDYEVLQKTLLEHFQLSEIESIISGGAIGTDTLAETFAHQHAIPMVVMKPDWARYGKRAGFLRNTQIIEAATHVIAFWDGASSGTKNSIETAKRLKRPLIIWSQGKIQN